MIRPSRRLNVLTTERALRGTTRVAVVGYPSIIRPAACIARSASVRMFCCPKIAPSK